MRKEGSVRVGLGLVVINPYTGDIFGLRERLDKPETGRAAGSLSTPIETAKPGETQWDTMLGVLPEITSDTDVYGRDIRPWLRRHIVHMSGNSLYPGFKTDIQMKTVQCGIAIVLFDSKDVPSLHPYNAEEVGEVGWRAPERFLDADVRPLAQRVVRDVIESGAYAANIRRFHQHPELRLPVLSQGFSVEEMYRRREKVADV